MVPWHDRENPDGHRVARTLDTRPRWPNPALLLALGLLLLLLTGCATGHGTSAGPQPTSPGTPPTAAASPSIYVAAYGSSLGENGDSWLYALQASGGAVRWRYHFPRGTLQVAQPALSNGTIYVTATSVSLDAGGQPKGEPVGAIYALRASDGTLLWHFLTTGEDTAPVTVFNGMVYAETSIDPTGTANGAIYALRAGDGSLVWRRQTDGDALGLAEASSDGIYLVTRLVLNNSGIVTALRPEDGSVLWQEPIGPSLSSGATLADGVLYIGADQAVYAVDPGNGQIIWRRQPGPFELGIGIIGYRDQSRPGPFENSSFLCFC